MTSKRALSAKQEKFVAAYLGEARGNATEAAALAGYRALKRATLAEIGRENLRKPEIAVAIAAELAALRREGVAIKQVRLDALNARWWLMQRVIAERAGAYGDAPGGATGLIVGRLKRVELEYTSSDVKQAAEDGSEPPREWLVRERWEYELDAALLREMRELEKQAAQEVGEAETSVTVKVSGAVRHDHRFSGHDELDALSVEDLERLADIRAKLDAGLVER